MEIPREKRLSLPRDVSVLREFLEKCGANKENFLRETVKFPLILSHEKFAKFALSLPLACDEHIISEKLAYVRTSQDWETRKSVLMHLSQPVCRLEKLLNQGHLPTGHHPPTASLAEKIRHRMARAILNTLLPSKQKQAFLKNDSLLSHLLFEEYFTLDGTGVTKKQMDYIHETDICSAKQFWAAIFSEDTKSLLEWFDDNMVPEDERIWFELLHQNVCQNKMIDGKEFMLGLQKILIAREDMFKQIIQMHRSTYCSAAELSRLPNISSTHHGADFRPLAFVLEALFDQHEASSNHSSKGFFASKSPSIYSDMGLKNLFLEQVAQHFSFDPTVSEFHLTSNSQNRLFIDRQLVEHLDLKKLSLEKALKKWLKEGKNMENKSVRTFLGAVKEALNIAVQKALEKHTFSKVVRSADAQ